MRLPRSVRCLRFVVLLMALPAAAMADDAMPPLTVTPPAAVPAPATDQRVALDLKPRLRDDSLLLAMRLRIATAGQQRALRIEPVKSIVEQGIEGSREALIACQDGPYPGATVSAYASWTSRSNAQPDHCYRF